MEENRWPRFLLALMKHLNLIILMYISLITCLSLRGYVQEHEANKFLIAAGSIPMEYWRMLIMTLGLYLCLVLMMSFRSRSSQELFLKISLEIVIGFFICESVHFGYAGVILLILADGMQYSQNMKWRIVLSISVCAAYLLMDYNLLSIRFPLVSLETMWMYYPGNMQFFLFAVLNILNAFNTFLFIFYMIMLILEQMSEKKRIISLNEELAMKNEELLQMAGELEKTTQTRERNRLAREIHDTLGHSLTGIITGIDACIMLMDIAPEATKEQLRAIADVARQGIKDVRRSVNALRPDALENMDLTAAIRQMIEESRRSTGVEISFVCDTSLKKFNQDEEDIIYRIVQEGITNAIRHGKATHVDVRISREFNMLEIDLKDNGIGCAHVKKGFGLHHMSERLQMLNGNLTYDGSDGFMIHAQIPIRWGEEESND